MQYGICNKQTFRAESEIHYGNGSPNSLREGSAALNTQVT